VDLVGSRGGPMGSSGNSMWTHADYSTFRLQTHIHRKVLVSLASAPTWIWWGPVGVPWGQVGAPRGPMRTIQLFVRTPISIEKHYFPLLLGPCGSSGVPWGAHGVQWGSMRTHADHWIFRLHTHIRRKALLSLASAPMWILWGPMGVP